MFSSLIAANVTGTYAFTFLPLPLPTQLINTLLPANSFALLSPSELAEHGLVLPSAGEGNSWVVIQAGQQIDTGMSLPGGRSTFQEAKLEIPFLRSTTPTPSSSTPSPLTYKHTLLFSSSLMALSSSNLTGLRSHKTEFTTEGENGETYEARGYLSLFADDESEGGGGAGPAEWDEELVRACAGGWWVGERTGGVATRFILSPLSPPTPLKSLSLRLHLPSFLQRSIESTRELQGVQGLTMDEDGWVEWIGLKGWRLKEGTKMETGKVGEV